MSRTVYVNGDYLPEDQAKVSIFDRGFLMADGVYEVTTVIDGKEIAWGPKDTFTAAPFAVIDHKADEESFLIRVHDRPLQDKLGYYEERAR